MNATPTNYPTDYLTRPNPLLGKQLSRRGLRVSPSDLKLDDLSMGQTFGWAETDAAVQLLLQPSRDARRWKDVSWLQFASPFGWRKPLFAGGGLLPGFFGPGGPGLDMGVEGLDGVDMPHRLMMPLTGLHEIIARGMVEWRVIYVGNNDRPSPLAFFRICDDLIAQLLNNQARNAAQGRR